MTEEATHQIFKTRAGLMILDSWLLFGDRSKIITDDLVSEETG